jgi:hypothetical protein
MPSLYLDKNDRGKQLADAVKQMNSFAQVREAERVWIVLSDRPIYIQRRQLDSVLGETVSDDEWRSAFRRFVGEASYDDQRFELVEEQPGDG